MRIPNVIFQDFSKRIVQDKKVKLVAIEASSAVECLVWGIRLQNIELI